jgi:hypothetical protein
MTAMGADRTVTAAAPAGAGAASQPSLPQPSREITMMRGLKRWADQKAFREQPPAGRKRGRDKRVRQSRDRSSPTHEQTPVGNWPCSGNQRRLG